MRAGRCSAWSRAMSTHWVGQWQTRSRPNWCLVLLAESCLATTTSFALFCSGPRSVPRSQDQIDPEPNTPVPAYTAMQPLGCGPCCHGTNSSCSDAHPSHRNITAAALVALPSRTSSWGQPPSHSRSRAVNCPHKLTNRHTTTDASGVLNQPYATHTHSPRHR